MYHNKYDDLTNSLISELEAPIDGCRIEQAIAKRYQLLRSIKDIIGPSKDTRKLIKEIAALEKLLPNSESSFHNGSLNIDLS